MSKIRIVICEDMEEIQNYFKLIIARESDMEVVGTATSFETACSTVLELKPDIVLMDVQMDTDMAGVDAIEYIKKRMQEVKIIVLTIHEEDEIIFKAYSAGAMDFITKTSSIVDILSSIRNVYKNNISLRPEVAQKIIGEFSRLRNEHSSMIYTLNVMSKLTSSEMEILKALYQGKSYRQVAQERCVEEVTIRTQINRILKKFDKGNIKEVVTLLKELRIFELYSGFVPK